MQPHITTFGNTSSAKARELRSSTSELTNGLHPDLNHRTVPVLDAICVGEGQHDVATVAFKGALGSPTISLENNRFEPFQNGRPLHR